MQSMSCSSKQWVLRVLLVLATAIAVPASHALAQSFNVVDFSCTTGNTLGVHIDIRGLGNTNLCVVSTVNDSLDCACVGGGGNCPTDTKKQVTTITSASAEELQPKNGRVLTTVNVTPAPSSSQCQLSCPSGQTPTLIQFEASAGFTVCTLGANEACTTTACNGKTPLDTVSCGPTGEVAFAGKHNSCVKLFQ